MKKILVPTDFSSTAHDAYQFALQMANQLGLAVEVLHVYSGVLQPGQKFVLQAGMDREESLESHLKEFISYYPDDFDSPIATDIKVETNIVFAVNVVNKIVRLSKADDIEMIIMGTKGEHAVINQLIGSTSTAVAQRAKCPVLLIPKDTKLTPFRNILFASNYESRDEEALDQIKSMAEFYSAAVHFVHVANNDETYNENSKKAIFDKMFEGKNPPFAFHMSTVESKSVGRGLTEYALKNDIDLLVLVNRNRDFISNIMQRSITQRMGLYTKLPIMVYHI